MKEEAAMCNALKVPSLFACRTCGAICRGDGSQVAPGSGSRTCFQGHAFARFWELSAMTKAAKKRIARWVQDTPEGRTYAANVELPEAFTENGRFR